jgi:methionyl-tRNA synthetase
MSSSDRASPDVASILARIHRPKRAVVTAGMPYANGPVHLGHLAGAQVPGDIHARWMGMVIGRPNVLYVCGTDEHGSTSELAALKEGVPIRELLERVHAQQAQTLRRYSIGLDVYTGTARPECFPLHKAMSQDFVRRLYRNGMLEKRTSRQWFDPKIERFLPDRFVRGKCPNPKCGNESAYSDECDVCGHQHDPTELIDPRSALSDATPVMRDTVHWYLDMAKVSETLRVWLESKSGSWRQSVLSEVLGRVLPALRVSGDREAAYKELRASLPAHKMKYSAGKNIVLQFKNRPDAEVGAAALAAAGIATTPDDDWAHRSITRDVAWGLPLPDDLDPEMAGKTLYVWPDSLIAPISFSQVALAARGEDTSRYAEFWRDPDARIYQFLGQDNVFFYVLMQGAMWLGTQDDPQHLPQRGELQMTEIFGCFHLLVSGEKMSKSRGNFIMGDQLLDDGYSADQIRYYLALLGLSEKQSNFDFDKLAERNNFLAGPMNATFERPISAAHSKFGGRIPEGTLADKVVSDTTRIVARYVKGMERADYPTMLYEVENYARIINSLFNQYKPHDDRRPEEGRRDALHASFYVLKNLMIMLYPFAPDTMDRVRESLRLPPEVFRVDELGQPMPAGHEVGAKQAYFPGEAERKPRGA